MAAPDTPAARTRRADRELSGVTVTRKSPTSTYPAEHCPRCENRMMDAATPPLAVDARHLAERYRSRTAVDGIDLQVRAEETFGPLGTNGARRPAAARRVGPSLWSFRMGRHTPRFAAWSPRWQCGVGAGVRGVGGPAAQPCGCSPGRRQCSGDRLDLGGVLVIGLADRVLLVFGDPVPHRLGHQVIRRRHRRDRPIVQRIPPPRVAATHSSRVPGWHEPSRLCGNS